jgi:hypothetical protein
VAKNRQNFEGYNTIKRHPEKGLAGRPPGIRRKKESLFLAGLGIKPMTAM